MKSIKFKFIAKFAGNGPVAEWLGSALQKLLQRFESARDLKITKDAKVYF